MDKTKVAKIVYVVDFNNQRINNELIRQCYNRINETSKADGFELKVLTYETFRDQLKSDLPVFSEYLEEKVLNFIDGSWTKIGHSNYILPILSDIWRIYALSETGGIYIDMDVEILEDKFFSILYEMESPTGFLVGGEKPDSDYKDWEVRMTRRGHKLTSWNTTPLICEKNHPVLYKLKKVVFDCVEKYTIDRTEAQMRIIPKAFSSAIWGLKQYKTVQPKEIDIIDYEYVAPFEGKSWWSDQTLEFIPLIFHIAQYKRDSRDLVGYKGEARKKYQFGDFNKVFIK